jgi:quinoprotein glucose dehydrogenase
VTAAEKAQLMAKAREAAAKGPVRYTSPYDFMLSPSNAMTAIGPPWSHLTAYDLNTGEIKWRVPDGGVTAPASANLPADTGSHMPRGGPLVTGGGLVFVATASDRTVRAYDRDNGTVIWKTDLPTGSEGVPASYGVNGRQFVVFPVAAGTGGFSIRFGGPGQAGAQAVPPAGAGAGGPEAAAAAAQAGRGRGRAGGPPPLPGAYIAYALPQR